MVQKLFILTIAKVHEQLFQGEADAVTVPTMEGEITVLAHHTPIIATLKAGIVTVGANGEKHTFEIDGGVLEISNNRVTILVHN